MVMEIVSGGAPGRGLQGHFQPGWRRSMRNEISCLLLVVSQYLYLGSAANPCPAEEAQAAPPPAAVAGGEANPAGRLRGEIWNFKFKDFPIGAFNGPAATDAEYRVYKECGFNVVITPRYLHYQGYDKLKDALDLAQKHGLAAVMETYTHHVRPWGGKAGKWHRHRSHHPATLPELKWIHQRYGKHPALIGYMLADDVGNLPAPVVETTRWMRENSPHLWPWVCQLTLRTGSLARAGNPLVIPQLYATLHKSHYPPVNRMQYYCGQVDTLRRACFRQGLLPMPMFNVSTWGKPIESDSIVRFQIYASLAYGAQGIWYFTYRDFGSLMNGKPADDTVQAVKALCDAKWYVAQEANHRVAAWGRELLWREVKEIYHTGWCPSDQLQPGPEELIVKMSEDLLVGIPRKQAAPPLAMVVDKRVDDGYQTLPPRDVELSFCGAVESIDILERGKSKTVRGNSVRLFLKAGEGQLLRLNGRGL